MRDRPAASNTSAVDRRQFLGQATIVSGAAAAVGSTCLAPTLAADATTVVNVRIKQSIVFWCFNVAGEMWDAERTCQVARQLGVTSVELLGPEHWLSLKKHGLTCAIAPNGMPGAPFMRGFNNRKYHAEVIARTSKMIDECAEAGFPSVIAFTGYKYRDADDPKSGDISREEGFDNCVAGFKKIMGHAEKKGINVCIEHLNSRDGSHPMKGHPGYQGDDVDYVADICRKVASPRMKLLFDIYHVQIMNGDVIRHLDQHKDVIGHIHTAGNPGRGELDDNQEINYPPIMRKLVEIGYAGFVGQEFIPTRAPLVGLQQAVRLCDV
jgi:sugar phosphate isomerase/epimerase